MSIHHDNRHGVKKGDLVEIVDYDPVYNGIQGVVSKAAGSIWHFDVTVGGPGYPVGLKAAAMYVGNLRPVDDSASHIPEDWS